MDFKGKIPRKSTKIEKKLPGSLVIFNLVGSIFWQGLIFEAASSSTQVLPIEPEKISKNGILLPKLFWLWEKKCSSDWEKLLKF